MEVETKPGKFRQALESALRKEGLPLFLSPPVGEAACAITWHYYQTYLRLDRTTEILERLEKISRM